MLLAGLESRDGKHGDKVVNTAAALRSRLQDTFTSRPSRSPSSQPPILSKAKLPQLDLVKFDVNRRNWELFWMQFASAVHNIDDLSKADKFNYLNTLGYYL